MARVRKHSKSFPVDDSRRMAEPQARRRKWIFRLAAVVVLPLAFLAVLEGALRLVGFGYPTRFLLHQTIAGQERVIENSKFGWRFFGPALARTPYPLNFPAAKPAGTVRIFVFGESAAYGDPQPDFGLPRVLEVLLRQRYPGVHFEIINAAMVAINSHVILPIARDCACEHGDIWLVYMGNNEVVGPFGTGTVFGPQAPPLSLIRTGLGLKTTRTGELLNDLLARTHGTAGDSAQWRGLMMFVQNQVASDDPRLARTYSQFNQNLNDILRIGTDSGARVIVSTVASNLRDCAPFGSRHSPALTGTQSNEWVHLYQAGILAAEQTNSAEATRDFAQAAALDDHFADLQFRWGRAYLSSGNAAAAREHFARARDCDTLRFRADTRINEMIRAAAANRAGQGIAFVDAAAALALQSPHELCGREFFYEHVHFTFAGNYALARLFADQIALQLPPDVQRRADVSHPWPDLDECARLLGWNAWSRHGVLASLQVNVPPFNFQLNHAEMLQRLEAEMRQIAPTLTPAVLRETAEQYRQLMRATPDDWVFPKRLAQVLQQSDDLPGAMESWRQVENLLPRDPEAPLQRNLLLLKLGRLEEAADEYVKAVKLNRNFAEGAYANLLNKTAVEILQKAGAEPAVPLFRQAIGLRPRLAEAHLGLGTALRALGKTNEAREEFRVALRFPPTTPSGLASLGQICYEEGWTNDAVKNLEAALSWDPTDSTAREYLDRMRTNHSDRP